MIGEALGYCNEKVWFPSVLSWLHEALPETRGKCLRDRAWQTLPCLPLSLESAKSTNHHRQETFTYNGALYFVARLGAWVSCKRKLVGGEGCIYTQSPEVYNLYLPRQQAVEKVIGIFWMFQDDSCIPVPR